MTRLLCFLAIHGPLVYQITVNASSDSPDTRFIGRKCCGCGRYWVWGRERPEDFDAWVKIAQCRLPPQREERLS